MSCLGIQGRNRRGDNGGKGGCSTRVRVHKRKKENKKIIITSKTPYVRRMKCLLTVFVFFVVVTEGPLDNEVLIHIMEKPFFTITTKETLRKNSRYRRSTSFFDSPFDQNVVEDKELIP